MKNKTSIYAATAVLICGFGSTASAASFGCQGLVNGVWLDKTGHLMVSGDFRGDGQPLMLCSTSSDWNGVPVSVCKSWISMTMAAQSSATPVDVWYNNVDTGATACGQLPTGDQSLKPAYVSVR